MNSFKQELWLGFLRIIRKFHLLHFIFHHRRLPKQCSSSVIDFMYKIRKYELADPIRKIVSDKVEMKKWLESIGISRSVPSIQVFNSVSELDKYSSNIAVIIKPTHMSGEYIYHENGPLTSEILNRCGLWLNTDFYEVSGEQNYRGLKKRIVIEPLVFGKKFPKDYKVFCFNGRAKVIHVDIGRGNNHTRQFYNRHWELQEISWGYPKSELILERPLFLTEILEVAEAISEYFDFIRVDFYGEGKEWYVGEITNLHGNNVERFGSHGEEDLFNKLLFDI